jgi:hypothetical protein
MRVARFTPDVPRGPGEKEVGQLEEAIMDWEAAAAGLTAHGRGLYWRVLARAETTGGG